MSFNPVTSRVALALAVSGALVAAPLAARGYHGGYWGPPRGCYNCGYSNGGDVLGAVVGSVVALGFIAAIASASQPRTVAAPQPAYTPVYPAQPAYLANPAPAYPEQAAPTIADVQVELCARAAERSAQNYGGFARTVSIESVTGSPAKAIVRGTLEINPNNGAPLNRAAFTCTARDRQVTGVQLG